MNSIPFQILCEQQMCWMQHKAQDMILQIKEDILWSKHCQDEEALSDDGGNTVEYPVRAETKDSSVQVAPLRGPVLSRNAVIARRVQRPCQEASCEDSKPVASSDALVHDLQVIKEKLTSLQLNVSELKSWNANSQKSNNYRNAIKHHPSAKEGKQGLEKRLQELSNYLRNRMLWYETERQNTCTSYGENVEKTVGFQIPYVLKEQRALERRQINKLRQRTVPISNNHCKSFDCGKGKNRMLTSASRCDNRTKGSESRVKARRMVQTNRTSKKEAKDCTDGGLGNRMDAGVKEKMPNLLDHQKCINLLAQKFREIQERENAVCEKWQIKGTHHASLRIKNLKCTQEEIAENSCEDIRKKAKISEGIMHKMKEEEERKFPNYTEKPNTSCVEENRLRAVLNPGHTKLYLDHSTARSVHAYKKSFSNFLRQTAHAGGANFNLQDLVDRMSESILDECLYDVAEELNIISSALVSDLYSQEFYQS